MKQKVSLTTLVLLTILLIVLIVIALPLPAKNIIAANVTVQNINVHGLPYAKANTLLSDEYQDLLSTPITLTLDGTTESTTLSQLGFSYDSSATLSNVKKLSFRNNPIKHLGARLVGLFKTTTISPVFQVDEDQLDLQLVRLFPQIQHHQDALVFADDQQKVAILPHKDGQLADLRSLQSELLTALYQNNLAHPFTLTALPDPATYTTAMAEPDAEMLRGFLGKKVTFYFEDGPEYRYQHKTNLRPDWLQVKNQEITYQTDHIIDYLSTVVAPEVEIPVSNAVIKSLPPEGSIWGEVEGLAVNGRKLLVSPVAQQLVDHLSQDNLEIELQFETIPAQIFNESGVDLGPLEPLGSGRSGFWGSDWGRAFNIRKGLSEKVNNIIIPPGYEYSFNDNLGHVTNGAGWANAYAIFGGDELVPVPGGGLCQVSTTLYRAVLDAGLDVLERYSHTLYVYYYEEYGNGLDATIYPGFRDFRFKNDTDGYLFIQAYTDSQHGYVNIFGTPKPEQVDMIGPIYSGRVPEEFLGLVDPDWNEIAWIKRTTLPSGEIIDEPLVSTYKGRPRKLYGYEEQ